MIALYEKIKTFFTDEEHKLAADVGEIHAAVASLARRVEALEAAVKAEVAKL